MDAFIIGVMVLPYRTEHILFALILLLLCDCTTLLLLLPPKRCGASGSPPPVAIPFAPDINFVGLWAVGCWVLPFFVALFVVLVIAVYMRLILFMCSRFVLLFCLGRGD